MYVPVDAYASSLFNSYIEMIEKHSEGQSTRTVDTDNSINLDYEIIVPVEPNDNFLNLISKMKFTSNRSLYRISIDRSTDAYINKFTEILFRSGSTIELGNMTLFNAIKFSEALVRENINDFFGLLLIRRDGSMLNPFHPVVSLAIEKEFKTKPESKLFKQEFRTIIFSIDANNKNIFNEFGVDANTETIIDNIALQMIMYQESAQIVTEDVIKSNIGDLIMLAKGGVFNPIQFTREMKYHSNQNIEFKGLNFAAMVPVQVAVKGVAFPWYGSVIAYNGNPKGASTDTYGIQLSPFLSANVGYEGRDLNSNETVFNSVCCGSYDRSKPEGLYTLNRSNFNSALNHMGLDCGWATYKNECIKASLEVYSSFIELDKPKPKKLTYKEQWLLDNPMMTEIDYLAHLRTKHTPTVNTEAHIPNPVPQTAHPNDAILSQILTPSDAIMQIFSDLHDDNADAARMVFGMDFDNAIDTGIQNMLEAGIQPAEATVEPVKRKRRKRNPETGMLE